MKPRVRRKSRQDFPADQLAKRLHDKLGQHLVGVTLATGALEHKLDARKAPELVEIRLIIKHLRSASREVSRLIDWLDRGIPR